MNVFALKIDQADPPFPRPAGFWWFGCSQNEGIVPDNILPQSNGDGSGDGSEGNGSAV